MEARLIRAALLVAIFCSLGASHRTQNFIVTTSTPQFAKEVAEWSEKYRRELSIEWLGEDLPAWSEPCPITAQVGPHLGAGGATSFAFQGGSPVGWRMTIQGSRERILDSVLPHEVTHTIFATHFGQPLPRWADEGACTTVEHPSEIAKQQQMLLQMLTTKGGIPFNRMFVMMNYPPDMLSIYAQGHSVASYLISQGGRQKFVKFVGAGLQNRNWNQVIHEFYGFRDLSDLQVTWLDWVRNGRPAVQPRVILASNEASGSPGAATGQAAALAAAQTSAPRGALGGEAQQVAMAEGQAQDDLGRWRHRDERSGLGQAALASADVNPEDEAFRSRGGKPRYAPGSTATVTMIGTSVARPQPLGQPGQKVLEWERSGPGGVVIPAPPQPRVGQAVEAAPPARR